MKTLYLLRHAKAAAGDSRLRDEDRPLNAQGHEAAAAIGRWMQANNHMPSQVLCSPSKRTRETFDGVFMLASRAPEVLYEKKLYLASAGELFRQIQSTGDGVRALMVIAHNPGIHEAALRLTASGPAAALDTLEVKYPTAALAILKCDVAHWREITEACGELTHFITPKALGSTSQED